MKQHDIFQRLNSIRRVQDGPSLGQLCIYDVLRLIINCSVHNLTNIYFRIAEKYPEWLNCETCKFPGPGQHDVPVATSDDIIKALPYFPGTAAKVLWEHVDVLRLVLHGTGSKSDMQHVADLLFEVNKKRKKSGHLYLVTSDLFDGVKCGMWSGTIPALMTRYRGVYGANLTVETFKTSDIVAAEKVMLARLVHVKLHGEIVEKHAWSQAMHVTQDAAEQFLSRGGVQTFAGKLPWPCCTPPPPYAPPEIALAALNGLGMSA